jgi:hypothetical protein
MAEAHGKRTERVGLPAVLGDQRQHWRVGSNYPVPQWRELVVVYDAQGA